MSEIAAISKVAPTPPAAAARGVPARALSEEVDLYAEANAFSEADWAGPEVTDLFGKDGFTFQDIVDTINPLHHLPVVGTIYRALTGDELAPAPRIIGGTLFGGIGGFVTSLANTVLENETGRDMGDTLLAQIVDDAPNTAVADASAGAPIAATQAKTAAVAAAPASTPSTKPAPIHQKSPSPAAALKAALGTSAPFGSGETEDPATALIQARAAVPAGPRAAGGVPFTGATSAITLPGGKALPIQFRSGKTLPPPVAAPQDPAPGVRPTRQAVEPKVAAPDRGPRLLRPSAAVEPPISNATPAAPPEQTPRQEHGVSAKMLDALAKYENLMRARSAPSISGEI